MGLTAESLLSYRVGDMSPWRSVSGEPSSTTATSQQAEETDVSPALALARGTKDISIRLRGARQFAVDHLAVVTLIPKVICCILFLENAS